MKHAPTDDHSIDRIDNSKGYAIDNCRWATIKEQQSNRRSNVYFDRNGERLCLSEWARRLKISKSVVNERRYLGWSIEDSLFTPVGQKRLDKLAKSVEAREEEWNGNLPKLAMP